MRIGGGDASKSAENNRADAIEWVRGRSLELQIKKYKYRYKYNKMQLREIKVNGVALKNKVIQLLIPKMKWNTRSMVLVDVDTMEQSRAKLWQKCSRSKFAQNSDDYCPWRWNNQNNRPMFCFKLPWKCSFRKCWRLQKVI